MNKNYYISGSWNGICDVCGQKHKASNLKKRWDGLIVCPDDYEERHPQDFVRAKQDKITVPFTRPRPTDVFVPQNWTEHTVEQLIVHDDNIETISEWYRDITDSVNSFDTLVLNIIVNIDDTVTTTESFDYLKTTLVSVNESLSITETVNELPSTQYSDNVTTSETITSVLYTEYFASPTDSITTSETITTSLTYNKAINGSPINRGIL